MGLELTSRQWFLLVLFAVVNLLNGAIFTLQAPFYPIEATSKNATATEYGIVFGVYDMMVFFACPIIGIIIPCLGSKQVFFAGILTHGTTVVLFGFLTKVYDHAWFLTFSVILRILEGIAYSATFVSLYSFVPTIFPDHVMIVYGVIEMGAGIGISLGPSIGGPLYDLGGFQLPFTVVGVTTLSLLLVVVPSLYRTTFINPKANPGQGVFNLLKKFSVSINFFSIFIQTISISFIYNNLQQYLSSQFEVTPVTTGFIFGGFGLFYGLLAPLWGYILGKLPSPYYMIITGAVLDFIGLVLAGPVPYLGLSPHLAFTVVGVFIYAIGHGAVLLATFINAALEAKKHGYPDDGQTAALVSGCYMSSYALGGGVGPPIAGMLDDAYGFLHADLILAASTLIFVIFLGVYACHSCRSDQPKQKIQDEKKNEINAETPMLTVTTE